MLESNRIGSFFVGVLVIAGLGIVNEGNITDVDSENTKIECTKQHVVSSINSEDKIHNTGKDTIKDDKEDVILEDFKPVLIDNIYIMDSNVSKFKIEDLKMQLDLLPKVLVDDFYSSGFKLQLYSKNSKIAEDSYLSTKSKTLKITHSGVSKRKVFTEFAYFLEYKGGISSNSTFKTVYNTEGVAISKNSKAYIIKSFQDYVLRVDSLSKERPLTYKFLKDYFIVMGGGTVTEVVDKPIEPAEPVIPDMEDNQIVDTPPLVGEDIVLGDVIGGATTDTNEEDTGLN